jgi:uncharacterized protein (DUF3084 family)
LGSVVFAFLLIMVAGGLIAYFGDRLGYQMGKKRVTLFGLRPRHTATTLTVISGVVIGAMALLLLIGVDTVFRVALLKGEQEVRTAIRLRKSNERLRNEADSDRSAALIAEKSAAHALAQTNTAEKGLVTAQKNLFVEQVKTAQIEVKLGIKQTALKRSTVALKQLEAALSVERGSLAAVQKQVAQVQAHNKQVVNILKSGLMHRRGGNLIYRDQGELGRIVISASGSQASIRNDLVRFLTHLSQSASAEGAVKGSNGRAVVITTIELLDKHAGDFVDENGSLDALADSIHSYGAGSVVVVATALGNSFSGDQVIIMLRPYADVLAIRAGTQIAKTVIDETSASEDEIAGQLHRFLETQVRPAATKAGVIPVKNPQTGKDELGEISFKQLYQTVTQIRQMTGPAQVTASVDSDVYSADQLKLDFTVKPAPGGVTL